MSQMLSERKLILALMAVSTLGASAFFALSLQSYLIASMFALVGGYFALIVMDKIQQNMTFFILWVVATSVSLLLSFELSLISFGVVGFVAATFVILHHLFTCSVNASDLP